MRPIARVVLSLWQQVHSKSGEKASTNFSAKAVFEDLVEDPSGQKGDLVVMVCNVLALER